MNIAAWDWGHLAVHFLWLCIGALIGSWGMALMAVARDCDRWAEDAAQQAATPAPAPVQDDGAAARRRGWRWRKPTSGRISTTGCTVNCWRKRGRRCGKTERGQTESPGAG